MVSGGGERFENVKWDFGGVRESRAEAGLQRARGARGTHHVDHVTHDIAAPRRVDVHVGPGGGVRHSFRVEL